MRPPYSKQTFEILQYVIDNGFRDVELSKKTLKQTDGFYDRVYRLEKDELMKVLRRPGIPSLYSVTEKGIIRYQELCHLCY